MSRIIPALTLALFLLWILPLGYFIKPSQEKIACDGQRGICMCSAHLVKKALPNSLGGIKAQSQSAYKEAPSLGGSASYFVSNKLILCLMHSSVLHNLQSELIPSQFFILPIDHVPKF